MLQVAVVCSSCDEESVEVVTNLDDVDRAACPCGYSYVALSVADYVPLHSRSRRLLTSKGGVVQVDGSIEWHDSQGRLHRSNGPARILPEGRREWFCRGALHRQGGAAVIHPDGRRAWYSGGEKLREETAEQLLLERSRS
jgi:hypothetical protein